MPPGPTVGQQRQMIYDLKIDVAITIIEWRNHDWIVTDAVCNFIMVSCASQQPDNARLCEQSRSFATASLMPCLT